MPHTIDKYLAKGTPSSQKVRKDWMRPETTHMQRPLQVLRPAVSDVIDLTGLSDSDDEVPRSKANTSRKQPMAIDLTKSASSVQAIRPNTVRGSRAGPLSRKKGPHPAKDSRPMDEENISTDFVCSASRLTRTAAQPVAGPSGRTRRDAVSSNPLCLRRRLDGLTLFQTTRTPRS